MFKKLLAVLAVVGVLAGCNTMEGAGRDVERAGEKMQEGANRR